MKLQVLVSAVNQEGAALAERMHLESDAVVINQTDHFGYEEYTHHGKRIQCYSFQEKGVGLSRNNALLRAEGDIVLFSDEDIVYDAGYEQRILDAFAAHPEADFLLFNVRVGESRATYYTNKYHRVHIWNAGRYPTYSFAVRREKLHAAHVTFSLLFGGGAKYSNGEDSLFLKDCLRYGLSVYAVPVGQACVSDGSALHHGTRWCDVRGNSKEKCAGADAKGNQVGERAVKRRLMRWAGLVPSCYMCFSRL